jgi:hypothetical protein
MLGNDRAGDCVWAGAAHETMVLGREGGHNPRFSTSSVLTDYSQFTGYDSSDPRSDQGTDVRQAARARHQTGILDVKGHRHKIGAYLFLEPGNIAELYAALYVFGVAGVGYSLPGSAARQFNEGKPWDVERGSEIMGGHYVPAIGRRPGPDGGFIDAVSWGERIAITTRFYTRYCDSALVYVSASALGPDGMTPEGFDKERLLADLNALKEES